MLAQGAAAVEQAQGRREKIPDGIRNQLRDLLDRIRDIEKRWEVEETKETVRNVGRSY